SGVRPPPLRVRTLDEFIESCRQPVEVERERRYLHFHRVELRFDGIVGRLLLDFQPDEGDEYRAAAEQDDQSKADGAHPFHFVFGTEETSLFLSPLNQSRIPSESRPQKPASGASARATSGRSTSTLPSSATLTVPTCWPFVYGAIRRLGISIVALRSL